MNFGSHHWVIMACLVDLLACPAAAHDGRRFDVQVVQGKLVAQGVNTSDVGDGRPAVRPYLNSIHDHWRDVPSLDIATAFLPEFDVRQSVGQLVDYQLELEWKNARKWVDPPKMPLSDTNVNLVPLDVGELISLNGDYSTSTSDDLGTLILHPSIPVGGILDMGFAYVLNHLTQPEIHVLTFEMRAVPTQPDLPALQPSEPIYVLLAPDGPDPMARLHHASLFLEERITTIPEPSTTIIAAVAALVLIPWVSLQRSRGKFAMS